MYTGTRLRFALLLALALSVCGLLSLGFETAHAKGQNPKVESTGRPVHETNFASVEFVDPGSQSYRAWIDLQGQKFEASEDPRIHLIDEKFDAQIRALPDEPLPRIKLPNGIEMNVIRVGSHDYLIPYGPQTDAQKTGYQALTIDNAQRFEKVRAFFLRSIAYVLSMNNLGFGVYVVSRERVRGFIDNRERLRTGWHHLRHPIDYITTIMAGMHLPEVEKRGPVYPDFKPAQELSSADREQLRQLGRLRIQQILISVDHSLKDRSPVLSRSSEFGVGGMIGVQAQSGVAEVGKGGAQMMGFSAGLDFKARRVYLELFRESEAHQRAITPVGVVGIQWKLYGYARTRAALDSPAAKFSGVATYPPMPIGFTEATGYHYLAAGVADSTVGFPSMFSAGYWYINNLKSHSPLALLTIGIRDIGLVRFHSSVFHTMKTWMMSKAGTLRGRAVNPAISTSFAEARDLIQKAIDIYMIEKADKESAPLRAAANDNRNGMGQTGIYLCESSFVTVP